MQNKIYKQRQAQFYLLFIQHRTAAITKRPPMVPPMMAIRWFEFGL